jgi:uncharacterized membrane protein YvbJ
MFCPNCGNKNEDSAKFCASCGNELAAAGGAPAGAAQPAAGPAQPAAKKKMALWKKIALGVVAFIVLAVGLSLFLTSDLVEPIDRQIAAFGRGDVEAAYAETSIGFRQATSLERFTEFVKKNPGLKQIQSHTFTERSRENNVGTVKGTLTLTGGGVVPVEYKLVKENDQWKILAVDFGGK